MSSQLIFLQNVERMTMIDKNMNNKNRICTKILQWLSLIWWRHHQSRPPPPMSPFVTNLVDPLSPSPSDVIFERPLIINNQIINQWMEIPLRAAWRASFSPHTNIISNFFFFNLSSHEPLSRFSFDKHARTRLSFPTRFLFLAVTFTAFWRNKLLK